MKMTFPWRADGGQILNVGKFVFQGIQINIAKKSFIFVIFQEGARPPVSPPLWIHACVSQGMYLILLIRTFLVYTVNMVKVKNDHRSISAFTVGLCLLLSQCHIYCPFYLLMEQGTKDHLRHDTFTFCYYNYKTGQHLRKMFALIISNCIYKQKTFTIFIKPK